MRGGSAARRGPPRAGPPPRRGASALWAGLQLLLFLSRSVLLLFPAAPAAAAATAPGAAGGVPTTSRGTRVTGYASRGSRRRRTGPGGADATSVPLPPHRRVLLRIHPDRDGPAGRCEVVDCQANETVRIVGSDGGIRWEPADAVEGGAAEGVRELAVEGLFGVYHLPSAQLWVWVAESEPVYRAPPIAMSGMARCQWWTIRRATRLELVRVARPRPDPLPRLQRREELRQVALLRQALKHHEWYFCDDGAGREEEGDDDSDMFAQSTAYVPVVPDMIHNLQVSIGRFLKGNDPLNVTEEGFKRQNITSGERGASTASHSPDPRFYWNQALVEAFADGVDGKAVAITDGNVRATNLLRRLVTPITSAFVGVQKDLELDSDGQSSSFHYDMLLITRRSRFRIGTRFTRRGADAAGHCANFAETEQVLLLRHRANATLAAVGSHLQTRGSIPLRWSSPTDIKTYRPRVRIGVDPMAQARALRAHVVDQLLHYVALPANVTSAHDREEPLLLFVNLIDKQSDQGRLGQAFDSVLNAVLDVYSNATSMVPSSTDTPLDACLNHACVQHIWFDFHAELRGGRWGRLARLLDQVKGPLLAQGYFRATPSLQREGGVTFTVDRVQTGITRTNCMDCLDRTNVVQSVFGRYLLFTQLVDYRPLAMPLAYKTAFRRNSLVLPWAAGELAHRLVWADNADAISSLYAGTPALKGDFTRTGRRTKRGALDDGMNSLQRFYLNNFFDAYRQEGMDLLVGDQEFATSGSDPPEPLSDKSNLVYNGMSLQEAARRALLGDWKALSDDDRDHVRIKVDKARLGALPAGGGSVGSKQSLGLWWLPGDLQGQVRDASLVGPPYRHVWDLSLNSALETLDARASRHLPWWCTSDDSSDSEPSESAPAEPEVAPSYSGTAGYLLVSLVAGTQAPLGTAGAVLAMMAAAMSCVERK